MKHSYHPLSLIRTTLGTLCILALSTNVVLASEFDMQPSSVSLAQKKPTATFTLTNSGSQDKIIKIQVMSFADERLSPSTRLIVHPDQLTLKSGTSQTVKVGIRMSGPLFDEETYRLVVTETPQAAKVGQAATNSGTAYNKRLALLPVTVLPPGHKLTGR